MVSTPTARAHKRDLVARLLERGVPEARQVFRARTWPFVVPRPGEPWSPVSALPALLVAGYSEKKELLTITSVEQHFRVTCTMTVQALAQAPNSVAVESALEVLAGGIEMAILTAPELLGIQGAIEKIERVDTKLVVQQDSELATGEAAFAFDMVWTEVFELAEPELSPCDDTIVAFDPFKLPS